MKVTQVALRPTEASQRAGRPSLTPELLAASGARYSRNNEGLESILSRIDPDNLDRSVDGIFRMIDYGHQSIADMCPVAMFLDGLSLWLAFTVWSLCPTAGGQESSTRYIRMSVEDLIPPEHLGIAEQDREEWRRLLSGSLEAYAESLSIWEEIASRCPQVARIPTSVMNDPSERAARQAARMRRNFGYDRARYFLPAAASTNVMLIMSARAWVQLCQHLLSAALPEPRALGAALREELELAAPRMLKHAVAKEQLAAGLAQEFERLRQRALADPPVCLEPGSPDYAAPTGPSLDLLPPADVGNSALDLEHHDNRYGWIGPDLRRTLARFRWEAVAFAEIRDLNRHRTGTRFCPFRPRGFYAGLDQWPGSLAPEAERTTIAGLAAGGARLSAEAHRRLCAGDPGYVYWTLLGTQLPFEHSTTADKLIYEAELRTGAGAHFRYADHLREILNLWYRRYPETRGLILEGSAEPE